MRVYQIVLRSGAHTQINAEAMQDDSSSGDKIYFYRDKALKIVVAYFLREEVAGIILDSPVTAPARYKQRHR